MRSKKRQLLSKREKRAAMDAQLEFHMQRVWWIGMCLVWDNCPMEVIPYYGA